MPRQTLETLQQQFGHIPGISFFMAGNTFPAVRVTTPHSVTEISLYGAQILSWKLQQDPLAVIWCGDSAVYRDGKAIRGGIPICWPWFGASPIDASHPSHGFARTAHWTLQSISAGADHQDDMMLQFTLVDNEQTRKLFPYAFELTYSVSCGFDLNTALAVTNKGHAPFSFSAAFHNYFAVSNICNVEVYGLESHNYIDETDHHLLKTQSGILTVQGETDRQYQAVNEPVILRDSGANRQITVMKAGGSVVTVWNPWHERAEKLDDFANNDYTRMICIESVIPANAPLTLDPGFCRVLTQYIIHHPLPPASL